MCVCKFVQMSQRVCFYLYYPPRCTGAMHRQTGILFHLIDFSISLYPPSPFQLLIIHPQYPFTFCLYCLHLSSTSLLVDRKGQVERGRGRGFGGGGDRVPRSLSVPPATRDVSFGLVSHPPTSTTTATPVVILGPPFTPSFILLYLLFIGLYLQYALNSPFLQ